MSTLPTAHHWPVRSLSDRHQERLLFRRLRATGDPGTRELILQRNLGLAASAAARYSRSRIPHDDRVQLARFALLKAIDRFDPDRGVAFRTFAVPTMVGEVQRYLRDHTWTVRPPRELQERVLRLERTAETLGGELGRPPSARELARSADLSLEAVLETLEAAHARGNASLDEPGGPGEDEALASTLGDVDPQYQRVENTILAEDLLSELTPHERCVLRLRFGRDLTQSDIGRLVGCSQIHVSRTIRAALEQLSVSAEAERTEVLAGV